MAPFSLPLSPRARLLALRLETPRMVFSRSWGSRMSQFLIRRSVHSSVTAETKTAQSSRRHKRTRRSEISSRIRSHAIAWLRRRREQQVRPAGPRARGQEACILWASFPHVVFNAPITGPRSSSFTFSPNLILRTGTPSLPPGSAGSRARTCGEEPFGREIPHGLCCPSHICCFRARLIGEAGRAGAMRVGCRSLASTATSC